MYSRYFFHTRTGFPTKHSLFVTLGIQMKVCILKNLDKLGYYQTWAQLSTLSVESNISADPQSWTGTENVVNQETCLSISYFDQGVLLWIPKASEAIHFRRLTANKKTLDAAFAKNLDEYFAHETNSFRHFEIYVKLVICLWPTSFPGSLIPGNGVGPWLLLTAKTVQMLKESCLFAGLLTQKCLRTY